MNSTRAQIRRQIWNLETTILESRARVTTYWDECTHDADWLRRLDRTSGTELASALGALRALAHKQRMGHVDLIEACERVRRAWLDVCTARSEWDAPTHFLASGEEAVADLQECVTRLLGYTTEQGDTR